MLLDVGRTVRVCGKRMQLWVGIGQTRKSAQARNAVVNTNTYTTVKNHSKCPVSVQMEEIFSLLLY